MQWASGKTLSWPMTVGLALAMVAGGGLVVCRYADRFLSARRIVANAPAVVTPGEPFYLDVRVTNRANGRAWPGARARLRDLTRPDYGRAGNARPVVRDAPEVDLEVDSADGGATPWQAVGVDGRVRFEAVADAPDASHTVGRTGVGYYEIELDDGVDDHGVRRAPASAAGNFRLRTAAYAVPPAPIHIVTDKPLYQPGQTIHAAVFAMTPDRLRPRADTPLTITLADARGNIVARHEGNTSAHGICPATFPLADDLNPGAWTLRAQAGAYKADKSLTVKRYVRRRIDVSATLSPPYFADDVINMLHFTLTYFNGQPAAGATVRVYATAHGLSPTRQTFTATADADGRAALPLPLAWTALEKDEKTGRPRPRPAVTIRLSARVEDGGTPESWTRDAPYVPVPVRVALLPEGGVLRGGADNRLMFAAWRPDGTPATGAYRVRFRDSTAAGARPLAERIMAVADDGYVTFSLPLPDEPLRVEVFAHPEIEDAPPVDTLTLTPARGLVIAVDPPDGGVWRAGAAVTGRVYHVDRAPLDGESARLTLALPGGRMVPARLDREENADPSPAPPARGEERGEWVSDKSSPSPALEGRGKAVPRGWRFTAQLPDDAYDAVTLIAHGVDTRANALTRRLTLPVRARPAVIAVTPDPVEAAPRDTVTLRLAWPDALPNNADEASTLPRGAACVTVADASILARAGGVTADAEARAFLSARAVASALPPPVRAALERGDCPFPVYASEDAGLVRRDNDAVLAEADATRLRSWRACWLSVALALVLGYILTRFFEWIARSSPPDKNGEHGVRLIELLVVIAIFAILAGMLMPALQRAREMAYLGPMPGSSDTTTTRFDDGAAPRDCALVPTATRDWFPETLAFLPEVVFDADGRADVPLTVADNMTRWRASAVGVARAGGLYAGGADFTVAKPFFLEADFPVAFIAGDEPELRVAAFLADRPGDGATVTVELEPSSAFDGDVQPVTLPLAADGPGRAWATFRPRFTTPGPAALTLNAVARAADGRELGRDRMTLTATVTAHGREVGRHRAGVLRDGQTDAVALPLPADVARRRYAVRVYPSPVTEYLDGVESLLRIPTGCFEQTSSANYPNIFILDTLQARPDADPALVARARDYLQRGYQRLLTFEVPGGGFSLYGHAPADPWLTAFGLMQFHDLSRHGPVDPRVLERTRRYLRERTTTALSAPSRQIETGSFDHVGGFVAWALATAGPPADWTPTVEEAARRALKDAAPYARLTAILAHLTRDRADAEARRALDALIAAPGWTSTAAAAPLPSSARGLGARAELLALAILACDAAGRPAPAEYADALVGLRTPHGWSGTQATTLALKALTATRATEDTRGVLTVSGDGVELGRFEVAPDSRVFAVPTPPTDRLTLHFAGEGRLAYTATAHGEARWTDEEAHFDREGLNIMGQLETTALQFGAETAYVLTLRDRADGVKNPIVEVGLGPALAANPTALDALAGPARAGVLRHEARADGVALYLTDLAPGESRTLRIPVTATRAGAYTLPPTRAWEYYRPENAADLPGPRVVVTP